MLVRKVSPCVLGIQGHSPSAASWLVQLDTQTHCLPPPPGSCFALNLLGAAAELGQLISRPQRKGSEGPLYQSSTFKSSPLQAQRGAIWVEIEAPSPNTPSVAATMNPACGLTRVSKEAVCEASRNSEFMS